MLIIIQARLASTRLPGKVLKTLGDRSMLARIIEQLKYARNACGIMIATSKDSTDDAIEGFCSSVGVPCFRGEGDDVAARLIDAAKSIGVTAFARVSGDSPWISPVVVDDVINLFNASEVDLATNVQQRTFPKGISVEVIRVSALRRAKTMMVGNDAEHVTPVIYRRPQDFRIVNLLSGHDWGAIQMSVDTPADFALAERMLAAMPASSQPLSVSELVAIQARCSSGMSS